MTAGAPPAPRRLPVDSLPPPPPELAGIVTVDPAALREASGSRGPVWITPRAVARPRHADEVPAVLDWCARHGLAVTPRGGATGMPGGNVGRGVILDLTALDDVELREDGRIRAGAGAVADAVDARARSGGRHLPALPSSAPWCTVGGMVATDAAGARSFRFGPVHAWTRGLTAIRADGTRERFDRDAAPASAAPWADLHAALRAADLPPAPAVRKNASGYDVHGFVETGDPIRLLCGSEGTLAVVTEVVFDTEPLPRARAVVLVGVADVDRLPHLAARAEATGATACEYFGRRLLELGRLVDDSRLDGLDTGAGVLLIEYAGSDASVERGLTTWSGEGVAATDPRRVAAFWGLRHSASPAIAAAAGRRRSIQFIEDCVVPRDALPTYVRGVEATLARHGLEGVVFGHAGDGNLHVNPLVDLARSDWRETVRGVLDDVVELVARLGGTLSGEHGDGRLRAPLLGRIWDPDHRRAFERVKYTLDPDGRLNPGVVLPAPGQDPLDGLAVGPDLQRVAAAGVEA